MVHPGSRVSLLLILGGGLLLAGPGCRRSEPAATEAQVDTAPLPAPLAEAVERAEKLPDPAAAAAELGRLYHANGYYGEARACYEAWAEREPANGVPRYYLADVARFLGDPVAERRHLEEVVQRATEYAPAWLWLAEARFKAGERDAARRDFETVLRLDPGNPFAHLGLAREYLQRDDPASARRELEALVERHPTFSSGLALLAQLEQAAGAPARAAQLREQSRARKDPPPEDPWLDELLPRCFNLQRLGIGFEDRFKAGLGDAALRYLRHMERVEPGHWQVRRFRGVVLAQQGQTDAAVGEFQAALAAGGDPEALYPSWVDTLVEAGRLDAAEQRAREGVAAAPQLAVLRTALAELRWRQRDWAGARTWAEQAVALSPHDLAARRLLARVLWEQGARAEARPHLESLVQLAPTDVASRALLGEYHLEADRPDLALPVLQEAWALQPAQADVVERLSLAWLRWGNQRAREGAVDEALQCYDRAVMVRPGFGEAYTNKARVLLARGKGREAAEAFAPLVRQAPESESYLTYGDILQAAGQPAAAVEAWRRAEQLLAASAEPALRTAIAQRLRLDAARKGPGQ